MVITYYFDIDFVAGFPYHRDADDYDEDDLDNDDVACKAILQVKNQCQVFGRVTP